MNEKYHNNKNLYIQFLKNWLTQIMDENKTIFVDDYHIDEIVPSLPYPEKYGLILVSRFIKNTGIF